VELGVLAGFLKGRFPAKGLRYPRFEEKPPFQTWEEIERRISAGGLTDEQIGELWDALHLTLPEIESLLEHVKEKAIQPWVYPLFCFAAYTGSSLTSREWIVHTTHYSYLGWRSAVSFFLVYTLVPL
jgi:hypothetical protein